MNGGKETLSRRERVKLERWMRKGKLLEQRYGGDGNRQIQNLSGRSCLEWEEEDVGKMSGCVVICSWGGKLRLPQCFYFSRI